MADDLPSLHALRCLEATARLGSMTLAGRELGLTHGAISRQVRLLEEQLGRPLFVRGHRRLGCTREGEAVASAMGAALSTIRSALDDLRRETSGPLILSCEPTLTVEWLIPRLGRLADETGLEVHVTQAGGPIDLERARVDAALRRDDFGATRFARAAVMDEWLGPVCAPKLARRRAAVLLETATRPDAWAPFRSLYEARGARRFDHFGAAIRAAIAGLGVTIGPHPLVADAIAAGLLVAPYGFVRGDVGYVLLSRRPFDDDVRTTKLLGWLRREGARLERSLARRPTRAAP